MANYTISETVTLPSKGKVYDKEINPDLKLRSMTTVEEMKRTSSSSLPYKNMCEVIEDCIIGENKPDVYELCLGDYQYLLFKLRITTYGNLYKLAVRCPKCGNIEMQTIDLDELELKEYDENEFEDLIYIELPTSKKQIKLHLESPKSLDEIERKRRDYLTKNPDAIDPRLLISLQSMIEEVDGKILNKVQKERFIQDLHMNDVNYIIKKADILNGKLGYDDVIACHCSKCENNFLSTFRITPEFYGPSID